MTLWLGFLLVVLGGVGQGAYFVVIKYVKPWRWENIWALYALLALLVFPTGLAFLTVPHLADALSAAPGGAALRVFLFGAGWGIGSVASGVGVARAGVAIGVAVLISVTAALGSLLPLIIKTPELVFARKGLMVMLSVVVLLAGMGLMAMAGKKREDAAGAKSPDQRGFRVGLLICMAGGIFSAMLNFAFAFSGALSQTAMTFGASQTSALNLVWMVALAGGFVPNGIYTGYLLTKNRSWAHYGLAGTGRFWAFGLAMATVWYTGVLCYGRGATRMGQLGSVIGWPLAMASIILASAVAGFLSGEWKGARADARRLMLGALVVLMVASGLLGLTNFL